jgi:hypothetical protein
MKIFGLLKKHLYFVSMKIMYKIKVKNYNNKNYNKNENSIFNVGEKENKYVADEFFIQNSFQTG